MLIPSKRYDDPYFTPCTIESIQVIWERNNAKYSKV